MKRVFTVILLAVTMFFGSQSMDISTANAKDYWLYSDGRFEYYADSSTFKHHQRSGHMASVNVKQVDFNGRLIKLKFFDFVSIKGSPAYYDENGDGPLNPNSELSKKVLRWLYNNMP